MDELPPRPQGPDFGDYLALFVLLAIASTLLAIMVVRHAQGP